MAKLDIENDASIFSIKQTATNLYSTLSFFAKPVKDYLIGNFYDYVAKDIFIFNTPNAGVKEVNFGLLGNLYCVDPNPDEKSEQKEFRYQIGPLLNQLDKKNEGRASNNTIGYLAGGQHLLSDTTVHAKQMRKLLSRYFSKSQDFTAEIQAQVAKLCNEGGIIDVNKTVFSIVYQTLAKIFFSMDQLPPETFETMQLFSQAALPSYGSALFPSLTAIFNGEFKKNKNICQSFNQNFLRSLLPTIMELLQSDDAIKPGKNLIVDVIISLIQEKYPIYQNDDSSLAKYLKQLDEQEILHFFEHDLVKSMPALLMLADNISKVIINFMHNSTRREQYYIRTKYAINSKISYLDTMYHKYLHTALEKEVVITRYTKSPIALKDTMTDKEILIKANSTLVFDLGSAAKNENQKQRSTLFTPYNHNRTCPGFKIAQLIFNTFVSELVSGKVDIQRIPDQPTCLRLVSMEQLNSYRNTFPQ